MSKVNCLRKGCKDVFNAFLVENAVYDGILEIPALKGEIYHPDGVIEFSKHSLLKNMTTGCIFMKMTVETSFEPFDLS